MRQTDGGRIDSVLAHRRHPDSSRSPYNGRETNEITFSGMRFFVFSLSLSKEQQAQTDRRFGFPQPMVSSTKPLLMFSESGRTAPPLNTFPQNDGRRDAFCLRWAPSLLPVKVRAVIGRQNRVGVKAISGRGAQEINCGWRYRLWDEKRYMREINVPQSPLFSPSD